MESKIPARQMFIFPAMSNPRRLGIRHVTITELEQSSWTFTLAATPQESHAADSGLNSGYHARVASLAMHENFFKPRADVPLRTLKQFVACTSWRNGGFFGRC